MDRSCSRAAHVGENPRWPQLAGLSERCDTLFSSLRYRCISHKAMLRKYRVAKNNENAIKLPS